MRDRLGAAFGVLILVPMFAACQVAMSVEQAKKVTASSSGASFIPPPRTIRDISELLRRPDEGIPILERVIEQRARHRGAGSVSTAVARGALGLAYQSKREYARALEEYRSAMRTLATRQSDTTADSDEEARTPQGLHRNVLIGYAALLAEIRGTPLERQAGDAADEAFKGANLLWGRGVDESRDGDGDAG